MSALVVCACACVLLCVCTSIYLSRSFLYTRLVQLYVYQLELRRRWLIMCACVYVSMRLWMCARATRSSVFVSVYELICRCWKSASVVCSAILNVYMRWIGRSVDVRTPVHCIVQYRTRNRHIVQYARSVHSEHTHTHAWAVLSIKPDSNTFKANTYVHLTTYTHKYQSGSQPASFSMDRCVDFEIFPHLSVLFVNRDSCVVYREHSLHCQSAGEDGVFTSRKNKWQKTYL